MDATHLRWYTAATLTRLFTATGFEVSSMDWTSAQWLPGYARLPFGLQGTARSRGRFVRWLVQRWPSVFGFQHIVVAHSRA
jgi:hypothetical protein